MTGDYPIMSISDPTHTLEWVDNFKEQFPRFAIIKIEMDAYPKISQKQGITAAEAALQIFVNSLDKGFPASKKILRTSMSTIEMLVSVKSKDERDWALRKLRDDVMSRSDGNIRLSVVLYPDDDKDSKGLLKRLDDLLPSARSASSKSQINYADEIQSGNITAFVQGIYNTSETLRGVELLARWNSPHGLMGPSEFLDSLQAQGAGPQLMEMLLFQANLAHQKIEDTLGVKAIVTVNVDARALSEKKVLSVLTRFASKNDVSWIELEIPDDDIPLEHIEGSIRKLHSCGYKISFDDFGKRYGWLAVLDCGVSAIKLEQALTRRIVLSTKMGGVVKADLSLNVLSSILNVAADSGFDVIAEGIESQDEYETLKELGVTAVQGFWLDKPASLDVFIENYVFSRAVNEKGGFLYPSLKTQ